MTFSELRPRSFARTCKVGITKVAVRCVGYVGVHTVTELIRRNGLCSVWFKDFKIPRPFLVVWPLGLVGSYATERSTDYGAGVVICREIFEKRKRSAYMERNLVFYYPPWQLRVTPNKKAT